MRNICKGSCFMTTKINAYKYAPGYTKLSGIKLCEMSQKTVLFVVYYNESNVILFK